MHQLPAVHIRQHEVVNARGGKDVVRIVSGDQVEAASPAVDRPAELEPEVRLSVRRMVMHASVHRGTGTRDSTTDRHSMVGGVDREIDPTGGGSRWLRDLHQQRKREGQHLDLSLACWLEKVRVGEIWV